MPTYFDSHEGIEMSRETRSMIAERVKSAEADEHGVIDRGVLLDKRANTLHCILEAPDPEAVRKHHEALGTPVEADEIHEVESILPTP